MLPLLSSDLHSEWVLQGYHLPLYPEVLFVVLFNVTENLKLKCAESCCVCRVQTEESFDIKMEPIFQPKESAMVSYVLNPGFLKSVGNRSKQQQKQPTVLFPCTLHISLLCVDIEHHIPL
jgi:hypothetical protein